MSKMEFNEFTREVAGRIREFLPDRFSDADVKLKVVTKNNDQKLTGIVVKTRDCNVCPTLYLESFYKEYEGGAEMEEIIKKIADARVQTDLGKQFDTEFIMDFGACRDRIVPRLVSLEMNRSLLGSRPHRVIEDLAVTYHVMMPDLVDGMASVAVTDGIMDNWRVTIDDLDAAAVKNLHTIMRSTAQPIHEVLSKMMEMDIGEAGELNGIIVCSNVHQMYGASCLLDKNFMAHVVEQYGGEKGRVKIILSSVHEILVVSDSLDSMMLDAIIREVNLSTVSAEEVLSNHSYTYDLENGLQSA